MYHDSYSPYSHQRFDDILKSGSSDEQSKGFTVKNVISSSRTNCSTLSQIVSCDKETVRILKLGGPFTISTVSHSVFDSIILAIVSKYLGVQSLSAMVVTHLLVGLTDTFIKGVSDTLDTLCSHAIGTDNYTLAGQYAQIAIVMYTMVSLPVAAAWWFLMDDAIRLFGMNEGVVMIGHGYSKILVGEYFVRGTFHTLFSLLDVNGYASQASGMVILEGTINVLTVWGLLRGIDNMNLFWVGVTSLCISVLVYSLSAIFVVYKGWLDPFWYGMTRTFALKNTQAVKNVVGTATPLALGTLLEYGEWEALTFFAAALGPAEGKSLSTWHSLFPS
jgi:Na+-driven multidrug efflux pump